MTMQWDDGKDGVEIGGKTVTPATIRLYGDETLAQKYIGVGRQILGSLKQQMDLGGLKAQYTDVKLEDGTKIRAKSNMWGLADIDEIWIDVTNLATTHPEPQLDRIIGFVVSSTVGSIYVQTEKEASSANPDYKLSTFDGIITQKSFLDVAATSYGQTGITSLQASPGKIPNTSERWDQQLPSFDNGNGVLYVFNPNVGFDVQYNNSSGYSYLVYPFSLSSPTFIGRNDNLHISISAKLESVTLTDITCTVSNFTAQGAIISVMPGSMNYHFLNTSLQPGNFIASGVVPDGNYFVMAEAGTYQVDITIFTKSGSIHTLDYIANDIAANTASLPNNFTGKRLVIPVGSNFTDLQIETIN